MIFRYAWRELKAYPRYTMLFIFNIVIGLTGLSVLESFKSSISHEVESSSRVLAGADLLIGSRIAIPETVLKEAESEMRGFEKGEAEELFTMISNGPTSRLAQVVARSANLPFYGEMKVEGSRDLEGCACLWTYPELMVQMNLKTGDTLTVGGTPFKIQGVVTEDPSAQLGRGALAPRVYMSRGSLQSTGLIQKGSTLYYTKYYKLRANADPEALSLAIKKKVKDSSINVRSHSKVSEASARLMSYLNDYLGLVTLIALLLSNIGAVYLFRAHLMDRLRDVSVLKMVGTRVRTVAGIYFTEILLLATAGVAIAIALSIGLFPVIKVLSEELLPIKVAVTLDPQAAGLVAIVGMLSTLLCVFPLIQKTRFLSANELFQESVSADFKFSWRDFGYWMPSIVFFYALAIWQSHSLKVASVFVGAITGAAFFAALLGYIGLKLLEKIQIRSSLEAKFAVRELARRPVESLTAFLALSIGALLASLVLTIESSIQREFDFTQSGTAPALFLFDIQNEQIEDLQKLTSELGSPLENVSPMIRARLETINGSTDFLKTSDSLKTREEEESERSLNRTYNLTERQVLSKSEELVDGRYFDREFDPSGNAPAEISLEERFAERLNVGIGDKMMFDVLGVPIEGLVVGIRRVKWASFQPNFFVQFQNGVFTETPKVFLASAPDMPEEKKLNFQARIVEKFPNVSILDVSSTVNRMMEMAGQMAWALKLMAALVLLSSIAVVLSIQGYHVQRNNSERGLLNLIGLVKARIRKVETIEAWILSFSSLFFGWLLSFLVAWPITYILFERLPSFSFSSLFILIAAAPVVLRSAWTSKST